jgi:hypothetical protein
MNAWACAAGADRTVIPANATAINFKRISFILPLIWPGNWTGEASRSTRPIGQNQG